MHADMHADLHADVRAALAAPAASAMTVSLARSTVQETLDSGLGTAPLRRLIAYYTHGPAQTSFGETAIREDIAWVQAHLDAWMRRQTQAQDDARALLKTLHTHHSVAGTRDAEELLAAAQAIRRTPDHWLNQPWADELLGRWNESLFSAVMKARQWLAAQLPAPPPVHADVPVCRESG
jgi:hypothetical protein